jgi:uncharacterized YkwD family protein
VMFNKKNLSVMAVSTAALFGSLAMAAPVSAATCPFSQSQPSTTQTVRNYTYRIFSFVYPSSHQAAPAGVNHNAAPAPAPTTMQAKAAPAAAQTKAPATTATTTATTSAGMTAEESQMLGLINNARAQAGLSPLKADATMTKMARVKSQDMINLNYFAHQSPTYGSPFDMMAKFGITYRTAGENIAGNSSVQGAFQAWMNSSGHRANILNSSYNYTGIGIVHGGQYGIMFTQEFVGR